MNAIDLLLQGFESALSWENLLWVCIGAAIGTLVGILPGLGPPGAIAILLPFSRTISPTAGLIMMAGIYYGAKYGGSATAILLNIPGESNAVPAAIEGYPLARKGRAGAALGLTTIGSFVGGTLSILGLTFLAPTIAQFALNFGPPEFFGLMILGITAVVLLSGDSLLKGLIAACVGILLTTIGPDTITGAPRFTFGSTILLNGVDFVALTIGLYALGEVFLNLEEGADRVAFRTPSGFRTMLPTRSELRSSFWPMLRGSVIGFFMGTMPGAGATSASFVSYGVERRISKTPEKFGTGHVPGLVAPETANNASTGGALIPLFTLGIPGGGTTAILLGALLIYGLQPGPFLFTDHPDVVWPIIASMFIGNLALVAMNMPLIPIFTSVLRLPYYVLYPGILVLSLTGVYTVRHNLFDVWIAVIFGALGYVMRKLDIPVAPLVLAFVLGSLAERALRQSLTLSDGNPNIFVRGPLSIGIWIAVILMLAGPLFDRARRARTAAMHDSDDADKRTGVDG